MLCTAVDICAATVVLEGPTLASLEVWERPAPLSLTLPPNPFSWLKLWIRRTNYLNFWMCFPPFLSVNRIFRNVNLWFGELITDLNGPSLSTARLAVRISNWICPHGHIALPNFDWINYCSCSEKCYSGCLTYRSHTKLFYMSILSFKGTC